MSNNIKKEFKEFINVLSTEICKEVLFEELQNINKGFNNTSDKFDILLKNYTENINGIKKQMLLLQDSNSRLGEFTNKVNDNSVKIGNALEIVNGGFTRVVDNILLKNDVLFEEYSKQVQALNKKERDQFIFELSKSLNTYSTRIAEEVSKVISTEKILSDEISGKSEEVKIYINNRTKEINEKIDNVSNELKDQMIILNNSLQKKNNIILGLAILISILSIVLVFK